MREEIKGPPVELGEEEREHSRSLYKWWTTRQAVGDVKDDGTNGNVSQAGVAKL